MHEQLFQALHCVKEQNHKTPAFDGFDGSAEDVGRQSLKILKNAHAERATQDVVRLFVVAVPVLCVAAARMRPENATR